VGELLRVDWESLARVEAFLAAKLGQPVRLPPVWLAVGPVGRRLARVAGASAITFGPIVNLARVPADQIVRATDNGRLGPSAALECLGSLLVHECTHVWQYRHNTPPVFLGHYLLSYYYRIIKNRSLKRGAHHAAYLGIPFEQEAYRMGELWDLELHW
jgi:hypothetical protein